MSDERFRALFEHVPVGLALCELDGRFSDVNATFADLLAGTAVDPAGGSLTDLVDPGCLAAAGEGTSTVARCELPLPTGPAGPRWVQVTAVRVVLGERALLLVHLEDTTSRRLERQRLVRLALHDGLTGLANRTLLEDRLEAALARAGQANLAVGLLYLDLDGFKKVNDSLGHDTGDALLVAVAAKLSAVLRSGDTAGRVGGDEFLVIAYDMVDESGLREVSRRVRSALARPLRVGDREVTVRASIGAVLSRPGEPGSALVRRADAAMYASKRARRRAAAGSEAPDPGGVQLTLLHEQAVVAAAR